MDNMKKLIEVAQKHIKDGIKFKTEFCPVALALKDFGFENVNVKTNYVQFREKYDRSLTLYNIILPRSARRFINRFDSSKNVEPFKFWLVE